VRVHSRFKPFRAWLGLRLGVSGRPLVQTLPLFVFDNVTPADALMRSPIDGYGWMMHIDDDGLCKKIMVDERRFRVLWNL